MKLISLLVILMTLTSSLHAIEIVSGWYDQNNNTAILEVVHGGGCGTHDYSLSISNTCIETYPAQASAYLIHNTNDSCESLISKTVVIDLDNLNCGPAYLTIYGENKSSITLLVSEY